MKEWYSAAELAGLPEMPGTERGVKKAAVREAWGSRKRKRGKGVEYCISSLPAATQAALVKPLQSAQAPAKPAAVVNTSESLWLRYEQAPGSMKAEAQRRLQALQLCQRLIELGSAKSVVVNQVAEEYATNRATLYRWEKAVKAYHASDWLAVLVPRYTGRTKGADCTPAAWEFFKADFLRPEKPTLTACYERLKRAAQEHGWEIPAARTINRWSQERIPLTVTILKREGEHALMRRYPSLERSVRDLHALQWINGDGYQHNVFVRWPNGEIARPKTWFWQDIYSRKVLAYRVDTTEHTDQIRLSFGDLVEQYGIPEHVTIDNTRAAANKWMTGGVANRYRFKVKDDDPLGLFPSLGIQIHWTSVIAGKGHGQAKPIERTFGVGGLGEYVDKHPAFAGAYTGENPMAKPDNYGDKAVPLEEFLQRLNEEIVEWNARTARRTEICAGKRSFDEAFNHSYAAAPIRKATAEQRRLWLLSAEAVTVKNDGTFTLEAGAKVGGGRNRYYAPELQALGEARQKIIVRFDPASLHESMHCYTLDNRYIAEALIMDSAGFGDTHTSRVYNRTRKQFIKAQKEAAKAEVSMTTLEVAAQLPAPSLPDPVSNKVSRIGGHAQQIEPPAPKPAEPSAAVVEAQARAEQQLAEILTLNQQPKLEEETDEQRYHKWLALDERVQAGQQLEGREAIFYDTFQDTPQFKTYKDLAAMGLLQQA